MNTTTNTTISFLHKSAFKLLFALLVALSGAGCSTFSKPDVYREHNPHKLVLEDYSMRWVWAQGMPEWTNNAQADAYRKMDQKLEAQCPRGWKIMEAKGEPGYLRPGHNAGSGLYRVTPNDPAIAVPFGGTHTPGYVLSFHVYCAR